MPRYLESGMRRDCCAVLHAAGDLRSKELKRRLEDHYETRLTPDQFEERLDALVSTGHVERRVDGIHETYALTDAGEAALLAHVDWLTDRVEAGAERSGE